jgi:hypothetical protein
MALWLLWYAEETEKNRYAECASKNEKGSLQFGAAFVW